MFRGMKPFEIFKAGTHTDASGTAYRFSDDDLIAIARNYDPALSEAPLVVGHPKDNNPAYGWVKSVRFADGRLVVEPDEVEPQFADLVRDGRFKKRSAAFYPPAHPNNPKPGQYYLRHVGFLGAQPPAVKGLKAVEFAAGGDIAEFTDDMALRSSWALENVSRLFRGLREYLIADKGMDTADSVAPSWAIDSINEAAASMRADQPSPAYSEPEEDMMDKDKQADLDRREQEIAAREAAFAEAQKSELEARRRTQAADDAAFVADVVKSGRLPIGLQGVATALFGDMGDDVLTFSEGDEQKQVSPRDGFRQLLSSLPLPVALGEKAVGDGPDFSDPSHVSAAIGAEIEAARLRGETLSAAQAAMRIQKR
jgi:hypothetical protein